MKNVLFFLALWAPVVGWGQTVEMEEVYLNQCMADKKWDQPTGLEKVRLWKQLRDVYPVIPFDTATKDVLVEHIITFPGVMKGAAFKRVKEWGALHFGSLEAVTDYEDAESGKIILEGWVGITYESTFSNFWGTTKAVPTSRHLYFSLVVTVKDGKAKMRYENLKYHYTVGGYIVGNTYFPVELVRAPLGRMFPITAGESGTWKGSMDLLSKTMQELNATAPSLEQYVRDVAVDYGF